MSRIPATLPVIKNIDVSTINCINYTEKLPARFASDYSDINTHIIRCKKCNTYHLVKDNIFICPKCHENKRNMLQHANAEVVANIMEDIRSTILGFVNPVLDKVKQAQTIITESTTAMPVFFAAA